jgi:hypothetical protein
MLRACDGNRQIPAPNEGRLRWFKEQFGASGHNVSMETVRKWFAGMTVPRQKLLQPLADILQVDAGWLSAGTSENVTMSEKRLRTLSSKGAVNIVAGFIQMDGGQAALPKSSDEFAHEKSIDLHAIIRNAKYDLTIVTSVENRISVPVSASENVILAVIREPAPGFSVTIIELDWEPDVGIGKYENGAYLLDGNSMQGRAVESFRERL